jgi:hypothetical protein
MIGPAWTIPVELVRGLLPPDGVAEWLRLSVKHFVQFRPHAVVVLREGLFVAVVTYEVPGRGGHVETSAFPLVCPAQENRT